MYTIDELMKKSDWKEELNNRKINIKEEDDYVILKYNIDADFSDEIVKQCRGIIFKKERDSYTCVCRPFYKFFNYQEPYAENIDWNSAKILEKIDGSIIKLWYDNNEWRWSTQGNIDANNAPINTMFSFGDIIKKSDNYKDINFNKLDTKCTYIFELVSPFNKIVVSYDTIHLYHIGTRDTLSAKEYDIDIGIEKPKMYSYDTLDECINAVNNMNEDCVTQEGFVVVDKNYNRVKVKSPKYFMYHRVINNGNLTTERFMEFIENDSIEDIISQYPELTEIILKYELAISHINYDIQKTIDSSRSIFEEFDNDRKSTANEIKKLKYPYVGFWSLDNSGNYLDYINELKTRNINRYYKLIEDEVKEWN